MSSYVAVVIMRSHLNCEQGTANLLFECEPFQALEHMVCDLSQSSFGPLSHTKNKLGHFGKQLPV